MLFILYFDTVLVCVCCSKTYEYVHNIEQINYCHTYFKCTQIHYFRLKRNIKWNWETVEYYAANDKHVPALLYATCVTYQPEIVCYLLFDMSWLCSYRFWKRFLFFCFEKLLRKLLITVRIGNIDLQSRWNGGFTLSKRWWTMTWRAKWMILCFWHRSHTCLNILGAHRFFLVSLLSESSSRNLFFLISMLSQYSGSLLQNWFKTLKAFIIILFETWFRNFVFEYLI